MNVWMKQSNRYCMMWIVLNQLSDSTSIRVQWMHKAEFCPFLPAPDSAFVLPVQERVAASYRLTFLSGIIKKAPGLADSSGCRHFYALPVAL